MARSSTYLCIERGVDAGTRGASASDTGPASTAPATPGRRTGPLLDIFAGVGPRSRELRFMAPKLRLTAADLRQLTDVDGHHHVALVPRLPTAVVSGSPGSSATRTRTTPRTSR